MLCNEKTSFGERCGFAKGHTGVCRAHGDAPSLQQSTTGHIIDPWGVVHPKHYNVHPAGVEAITVIEHMTFNVGSAIKYCWRVGLKTGEPSLKDLDKAIWYLNRERARLEKMGVK